MTPNIPIDITHQTSRSECPEIEILEHFVSGQLPENVDLQIERHHHYLLVQSEYVIWDAVLARY